MSVVRTRVAAASALAFALTAGYLAQGTYAAGTPANKVAASGSEALDVPFGTATPILTETVKINNPTDLILGVSLECSITTEVKNGADGELSSATGQIKIYVTIDGVHVPISAEDTDKGRVVFCSRTQEQQWTNSPDSQDGDEEDELRQKLLTRDSNAFNWLALNIGTTYPGTENNIHEIKVFAEWDTDAVGDAVADATIGNRTLVLEPVKAANDEVVTELG